MKTQYLEAAAHQTANKGKCLEIACLNLTDPTLSRYYRMKNLFLVACSAEDWYERERARREIDRIWSTANRLTNADDEPAQKALHELRGELDGLTEQLKAEAPGEVDETLLSEAADEGEEDRRSETDEYGDTEEAVREAERVVFGDDSNIIAMYERSAAAGRAAREARERERALGEGSEGQASVMALTGITPGSSEDGIQASGEGVRSGSSKEQGHPGGE